MSPCRWACRFTASRRSRTPSTCTEGEHSPTRDPLVFLLYVSFFPQLIAGPIERSSEMFPQLSRRRTITPGDIEIGVHLVCWGLLKKMVIADNLGQIADFAFVPHASRAGLDLALGVLAYSFQIYCDFSGYSDIARGIARLMGFKLPLNFRLFPYFSAGPSEFWQRWHITLSSWLLTTFTFPWGETAAATEPPCGT